MTSSARDLKYGCVSGCVSQPGCGRATGYPGWRVHDLKWDYVSDPWHGPTIVLAGVLAGCVMTVCLP